MGTLPMLYRCNCGKLLRRADINRGACLGHQLRAATEGNFFEWLKVGWWKLTGRLNG